MISHTVFRVQFSNLCEFKNQTHLHYYYVALSSAVKSVSAGLKILLLELLPTAFVVVLGDSIVGKPV